MAEGEALLDTIFVGRMDRRPTPQTAPVSRGFGLHQVAPACAGAQNLATCGDFEPLGGGFLGFDAFRSSHKSINFLSKKSAQYRRSPGTKQEVFWIL
jgi:hypothetical protein